MRGVVKHAARNPVLRIPTEHEEQREFVRWFRQTYPSVRVFAVPNGGARNIATAARLKLEGVTRGVPDLCIPAWRLWVEMKRKKNSRVDEAQKDWHQYLEGIGHTVVIGHGWQDAAEKIETFKRRA